MDECNCELVIDSAGVSDSVQIGYSMAVVASAAMAFTFLAFDAGAQVSDSASATTVYEMGGGALLIESAQTSNSLALSARASPRLTDRVVARDVLRAPSGHTVTDSAQVSSLVVTGYASNIIERLAAVDVLQASSRAHVQVREKARAFEVFDRRHSVELVAAAQVLDLLSAGVRTGLAVVDSGVAQAMTDLTDTQAALTVLDRAVVQDVAQAVAVGTGVLMDNAFAEPVTNIVADAVVWTCAVETFGMSHFDAGALRSLAAISGRLLGVGGAGVFYNDAPSVGGHVETGLTDFNSAAMKRATHAYVGYSGEPMTLHVGNTGSGAEQTYSYPLPLKQADAFVAGRFTLGRGAYSRYWRLGVSGPSFELHSIELAIAETSRRV